MQRNGTSIVLPKKKNRTKIGSTTYSFKWKCIESLTSLAKTFMMSIGTIVAQHKWPICMAGDLHVLNVWTVFGGCCVWKYAFFLVRINREMHSGQVRGKISLNCIHQRTKHTTSQNGPKKRSVRSQLNSPKIRTLNGSSNSLALIVLYSLWIKYACC